MAFSFSSTGGSSGVTSITVSATSRQELTDIVQNFTLSNQTKFKLMPIAQRAYKPLEKYIIFQPTGITWNSSGDTASLNIQSNDDWNIVADGWIQLSRYEEEHRGPIEAFNTLSGNGNTIIGIRCSENTGNTRTGGITGYCQSNSAISATTTVSQAGSYVKPYLALDKYIVDMPDSGMSGVTLIVNSNIDWITSTDSRWIDIDTTSGSSSGTIVFNVSQSDQSLERRGSIYVSGITEDIYAECVVAQSGVTAQTPYIIIVPTDQSVPTSGDSFVITVSSNTSWDVSIVTSGSTGDSRTWITTNVLNGYGDDEVRVNVSPMAADMSMRTGYISFHNDRENLKAECNISQIDNTIIRYTTTDGNIVRNVSSNGFGANLISNTYENGVGILKFDGPVTKIGRSTNPSFTPSPAFDHSTTLLTVEIPDSVTFIGVGAFLGCSSLSAITIPSNVEGIGTYAFESCTGLRIVYWNTSKVGSVDRLWTGAYSAVTDVIIGEGVTAIPQYLCQQLKNPINVVFPSTLTTIPRYAFEESGIEVLRLPSSIELIEGSAFRRCNTVNTIYSYNMTEPDTEGLGVSILAKANSGVLHYPVGGNYYVWTHTLPSGWTAVADL